MNFLNCKLVHERNNNFILQKSSTYRVGVNEKKVKLLGQALWHNLIKLNTKYFTRLLTRIDEQKKLEK